MDDLYLSMFLEETSEQLETMEQALLNLENEADINLINNIFRVAHSIKGAAATMGINEMANISHSLESLLDLLRNNVIDIDESIINIFFEGLDYLKIMHDNIRNNEKITVNTDSLLDSIETILNADSNKKDTAQSFESEQKESIIVEKDNFDTHISNNITNSDNNEPLKETDEELDLCADISPSKNVYKIRIVLNQDCQMKSVKCFLIINNLMGISDIIKVSPENYENLSDDTFTGTLELLIATKRDSDIIHKNINSISEIEKILIKKIKEKKEDFKTPKNVKIINSTTSQNKETTTVRVDVTKIDKMLNMVGEFIIDKENLNQIGLELKKKYKNDPLVNKLANLLPHIGLISSEMQETIMSMRMLPLEFIFHRYPRMVRDLSKKSNKKINFLIEGQETEVDRGIIEELSDPLTHIIRNAIDHGVESTEDRIKNGKNETGLIKLSARNEENHVVVEVQDDGSGIDINRIKEKIIEKNLCPKEKLDTLTENEIINYIFEPGFSTSEKVTDISGRGVGMDVVKANIGKLNGIIDIKTELGKGSSFIIKLPLTLAIIQSLLIKEGEFTFAIPITSIIETIRIKDNEINERIHSTNGVEVFEWRDGILPIIRMNKYFDIKTEREKDKYFIVIVGFGEKKVAVIVEKLIGEQEIVIKSIGDFIGENKLLGNIKGISGVSILGDGSIAQVLDIGVICKEKSK